MSDQDWRDPHFNGPLFVRCNLTGCGNESLTTMVNGCLFPAVVLLIGLVFATVRLRSQTQSMVG
jgi:hypothetical protein